jgi:hypothetical protein
VSATLTYSGPQYQPRNLRLTIAKAGQVLYDQAISPQSCQYVCEPGELRVLDLDGDGQPDVYASFFSGGAHCCEFVQIFRYDPGTMSYSRLIHDFGDFGAVLKQVGGVYLFVAADEAFVEQWTSFAASGAPIQILRLAGRGFVNVTRRHPHLIAADAARWWRFLGDVLRVGGETEGVLGAWAADEYLLGHRALVAQRLHRQLARGHIRGALPGSRFVRTLPSFLHRHGYG